MTGEDRTRSGSTSAGGKNYYPSIDELVDANGEDFKCLTDKLTKDWLLCLLKDSIAHLRQAKSTIHSYSIIDDKIKKITEDNSTIVNKLNEISASQPIPRPLTEQFPTRRVQNATDDYNIQLKFVGVPEIDVKNPIAKQLQEKESIENIISDLGANSEVADCRRLGRYDSSKNRPVLVTFNNIWDKRKCLNLAIQKKYYNHKRILIIPELSPTDKLIEKALLRKRYDLINTGVDKSRLRIRNLKLYQDEVEVANS